MKIEKISIFITIIILINIYSFIIMFLDKRKSILKKERTPEASLFFWAICFASLGIFLAMHLIKHKNRKWYFNLGIPLLIVQQTIIIWQIFSLLD